MDPTLEIKYINGVVTQMMDMDICVINNDYHYKPQTDKEIRNFAEFDVNSPVRVSLYKKKNSSEKWRVASCYLAKEHQPAKYSYQSSCKISTQFPLY